MTQSQLARSLLKLDRMSGFRKANQASQVRAHLRFRSTWLSKLDSSPPGPGSRNLDSADAEILDFEIILDAVFPGRDRSTDTDRLLQHDNALVGREARYRIAINALSLLAEPYTSFQPWLASGTEIFHQRCCRQCQNDDGQHADNTHCPGHCRRHPCHHEAPRLSGRMRPRDRLLTACRRCPKRLLDRRTWWSSTHQL